MIGADFPAGRESLGDAAVKPCAPSCAKTVVEGVVDQRVGEPETTRNVRRLGQDRRLDALFEQVEKGVLG